MMNPEELTNRRNKAQEEFNVRKEEKDNIREDRNMENRQQDMPEILTNPIYTPAFLREHIGRLMQVEFLIGTNNMVDRVGFLEDVGASYILLRTLEGDSLIYADIYSIKFITISATYTGTPSFQNFNNMPNIGMCNNINRYY